MYFSDDAITFYGFKTTYSNGFIFLNGARIIQDQTYEIQIEFTQIFTHYTKNTF